MGPVPIPSSGTAAARTVLTAALLSATSPTYSSHSQRSSQPNTQANPPHIKEQPITAHRLAQRHALPAHIALLCAPAREPIVAEAGGHASINQSIHYQNLAVPCIANLHSLASHHLRATPPSRLTSQRVTN